MERLRRFAGRVGEERRYLFLAAPLLGLLLRRLGV